MENNTQDQCRRCGACCEKGGPTLHLEDRPLVESGKIPLKDLFTIRKGEMVLEPMQKEPVPASEELVKIKGRGGSWCCRYLEEEGCACRIYEDRPVECRAQKCWDSAEIEAIYAKGRIGRKDLVAGLSGIWELVEEHEKRCSYPQLASLAEQLHAGESESAASDVTEMISYDRHLRDLVAGKGGMDPQILDFLFGRPMTETVHGFGLRVEKDGDRIVLKTA